MVSQQSSDQSHAVKGTATAVCVTPQQRIAWLSKQHADSAAVEVLVSACCAALSLQTTARNICGYWRSQLRQCVLGTSCPEAAGHALQASRQPMRLSSTTL